MGTRDRKEREKEQLKELILNAAREVFIEKGYDSTSIRNIAERIEYSPGTIYLYFKDKDTIFHELHKEGFKLLQQQMVVLMAVSDPFERLKAMGRVYMDFAQKHPDYYDLMFVVRAPMNALGDACWDEGDSSFGFLVSVVEENIQAGRFKGHNSEDLAFVIWSAMHGMVTLGLRGRCKVISEEKRDQIDVLGLDAFIQLLSES